MLKHAEKPAAAVETAEMRTNSNKIFGVGVVILRVMQKVGKRQFGLHATRAAKRHRLPAPQLSSRATLRALKAGDIDAVLALDAKAFGVNRKSLFNSLLPVSKGMVLVRASLSRPSRFAAVSGVVR